MKSGRVPMMGHLNGMGVSVIVKACATATRRRSGGRSDDMAVDFLSSLDSYFIYFSFLFHSDFLRCSGTICLAF
jgi:hypothetical protein